MSGRNPPHRPRPRRNRTQPASDTRGTPTSSRRRSGSARSSTPVQPTAARSSDLRLQVDGNYGGCDGVVVDGAAARPSRGRRPTGTSPPDEPRSESVLPRPPVRRHQYPRAHSRMRGEVVPWADEPASRPGRGPDREPHEEPLGASRRERQGLLRAGAGRGPGRLRRRGLRLRRRRPAPREHGVQRRGTRRLPGAQRLPRLHRARRGRTTGSTGSSSRPTMCRRGRGASS